METKIDVRIELVIYMVLAFKYILKVLFCCIYSDYDSHYYYLQLRMVFWHVQDLIFSDRVR